MSDNFLSNNYFFKFLDESKKRAIIKYSDNSKYEGYVKDQRPHGYGKIIYDNSSGKCESYIGDFVEGKMEGFGTYNAEYEFYKGQWKDHKYHGEGHLMYHSGEYIGTFANGYRSGKGTLITHTGDKYTGDFKEGWYNGTGKLWLFNGNICEGKFVNGFFIDGKCSYKFKNGDTYLGGIKNHVANGIGTWYDSMSNLIYKGNWIDGNLTGPVDILTKHPGKKKPSILHNQIDFNTFINKKHKGGKYDHYLLPPQSIYNGRSESGIKKFIKNSMLRATFIERESGDENTLGKKSLYTKKPSSYFVIASHGVYRETTFKAGDELSKFIVPDGIRLIFFDRSEINLSSIIDMIPNHEDFMKPSLIQRKTYRKITPAVLFSELKDGQVMININDAINKTIYNRTHQVFHEFLRQQKRNKDQNRTISKILTDIRLEKSIELFHSNGFTHYDNIVNMDLKDLTDLGLKKIYAKRLLRKISELKKKEYGLSIYNSGMECVDLSLLWNHELSKTKFMKVGIYPLPNTDLTSKESLHNEDGSVIKENIFKGSFMPYKDVRTGKIVNYTNAMQQWNTFSNLRTLLSDLINYLPRGTVEHPCVYFISACRQIGRNLIDEKKGLLRQHSSKQHSEFVKRQLSE